MERLQAAAGRLKALLDLMRDRRLDALVLSRHANCAWLGAGGRTAVNWGQQEGEARLVVTPEGVTVVTSNIEARRLEVEEFAGLPWRYAPYPWWQPAEAALAAALAGRSRVGCDGPLPGLPGAVDVSAALADLRSRLDAYAQATARRIGQAVGQVLAAVARSIAPGMTEYEIAGRLLAGMAAHGLYTPVCLVAADDRFYQWRHFLPTDRRLERYACLVVCCQEAGLVLSATRLVHFGPPPPEVLRRVAAVQRIDAALIAATRPGATAGDLFAVATRAYAEAGFADEWQNHHQGGLAGYAPREWVAVPGGTQVVAVGQIYAWNPSVPGAKSEDTILVGPDSNEILTDSGDFPYVDVAVGGVTIRRPALLVRESPC